MTTNTKTPSIGAKRAATRAISSSTALKLYHSMKQIRRAEEALMEEYHPADEMRCPIHFCVGQEAPPVGVCLNLRRDDYLFTGHRSHGYYLAKGGSLKGMFAEFYGKSTGSNGGMAGSQELSDEDANFYSGTILTGTLAIAAGAALASQMRGEDRVTVAVFGDGGADEGIAYETMNFAALKKLPMVFICENNMYSITSRQSSRQALSNITGRARAFGVPARSIYGNDVIDVSNFAGRAIAKARKGLGPSLLELETYRWCAHVGPEDDDHLNYRTPEELAAWKEQCPIEILKGTQAGKDILNPTTLERIDIEIAQEIEEAFAFAKSSPFPHADELFRHMISHQKGEEAFPGREIVELSFDPWQAAAIPRPY